MFELITITAVEQLIILFLVVILTIMNIIQHYYLSKTYKVAKEWKYHAKEIQKELVKKTKYIDEFFHVGASYKTWSKYQNDENNKK